MSDASASSLGLPSSDVSPLSVACARELQNKDYDKRKAAAKEIEMYAKMYALP